METNMYIDPLTTYKRATVFFSSTAGGAALSVWNLDLRVEGDRSGESLTGKDSGSSLISWSMMFSKGWVSALSTTDAPGTFPDAEAFTVEV